MSGIPVLVGLARAAAEGNSGGSEHDADFGKQQTGGSDGAPEDEFNQYWRLTNQGVEDQKKSKQGSTNKPKRSKEK